MILGSSGMLAVGLASGAYAATTAGARNTAKAAASTGKKPTNCQAIVRSKTPKIAR